MHVPRRQRNQASNSDHIEFAAEITTSLLDQVRHLQTILAERDESLKQTSIEKSRLEGEAEGFAQRLKQLDDSEQRYKDENWNLETQMQDLQAQHKDAISREARLQHALTLASKEQTQYEREYEDLRQSHAQLTDEHAMMKRQHETETTGLRKDLTLEARETSKMQRRVEELAAQNEQLAQGLAHMYKEDDERNLQARESGPAEPTYDISDAESPPPSPSKGNPRHNMLESETLKSSLHHAHRMIQTLKNNMHKEKAEKLELKRMLQDARDELECAEPREKRSRVKQDSRKGSKAGLGAVRNSRVDIEQDPEWEDQEGLLPRPTSRNVAVAESSDAYQTANDTEDSAFETANEREAEVESIDAESEGDLTETETAATKHSLLQNKKSPLAVSTTGGNRQSAQSSPSSSEDDTKSLDSSVQGHPQRFRLKLNRRSHASRNSPASIDDQGQSLFAELENMSGSEADITPSRSIRSQRSPRSLNKRSIGSLRRHHATPPLPSKRMPTVDTGVMTEPWEPKGLRMVSSSTAPATPPPRAVWDLHSSESNDTTPLSVISNEPAKEVIRKDLEFSKIQSVECGPRAAPASSLLSSILGWKKDNRESFTTQAGAVEPLQDTGVRMSRDDLISPGKPFAHEAPNLSVDTSCEDLPKSQQQPQTPAMVSLGSESQIDTASKSQIQACNIFHTNISTQDSAAQTMLSGHQIDDLLAQAPASPVKMMKPLADIGAPSSRAMDGIPPKALEVKSGEKPEVRVPEGAALSRNIKRPGSTVSVKPRSAHYPPLPPDHQEAIAAAAQKAPDGLMGPPPPPQQSRPMRSRAGSRPQTPSQQSASPAISTAGTTPRALRFSSTRSQMSRRSSVSSFASELDQRFNIRADGMPAHPGFLPGTDPRMIQAITQTMIGEMMWKYTRKTGRGEMSSTRHARFFWVHPYTRTLYWSDRDPTTANRSELKSKSVAIEAVRVVTDDNPMPPGLHRKSLIIVTPGRSVKITAQTSQRHETWFNALSYLLLRNAGDGPHDLTEADAREFNPAQRDSRGSTRDAPVTLSGTQGSLRRRLSRSMSRSRQPSRTQMAETGPSDYSTVSPSTLPAASHASVSSRISSLWKPTIRDSGVREDHGHVGGTNSPHDSHDGHGEREREAGLENVRACCDGEIIPKPRVKADFRTT